MHTLRQRSPKKATGEKKQSGKRGKDVEATKNDHLIWVIVIVVTVLLGNALSAFDINPLPRPLHVFFSDKGNPLNVYFVKYAWGWTFSASVICLGLGHCYLNPPRWKACLNDFLMLVIWTAFWYFWTEWFFFLREYSEQCSVPDVIDGEAACSAAGGNWFEFDISGHSFLLSMSILVLYTVQKNISRALASSEQGNLFPAAQGLFFFFRFLLTSLQLLWLLMLAATSLYFHKTVPHYNGVLSKTIGTFIGICSWAFVYFYCAWS
eukprot:m.310414 g.310414  ORF g.310414 m.310414 type:complete len:264 (+) comp51511_c0_seq1:107-898(+)